MAKNELHLIPREGTGKSVTRKLRKDGKIPAVVYGRGEESYSVSVDFEEFKDVISHLRGKLLVLKLTPKKGESFQAAIKAIQRHPLTDDFLNIDFQKIHPGEMLHVSIPVKTHGTPAGLKMGGILDHVRYEIDVRGPVSKLPSHVDLDITDLDIGDSIRIADVEFKEGVEVLDPPQAMIVTVASTRRQEAAALAAEEEAAAAAAAEGEGEGEGEEGAEGEAASTETETKE